MTETWEALWALLLLPLAGSAISGALHFAALRARRAGRSSSAPERAATGVACLAVAASFVLAVLGLARLAGGEVEALASSAWDWIHAGSFEVDVALVLDRLSAVMALVVTGVGALIHVYSVGYMKGDPGYAKFFAFLNLFVFFMLLLVLSSSLLGLFVGWEGVGLASYLLIGFWYLKSGPAEAGQKAFVVNRVGDASFLVGSFLLVGLFGTLDLAELGARAAEVAGRHPTLVAIAALLLFGGACGKSAQWPLFTWLPDAMAGPTPVSALIHAATMVTAGVYLVVRLNPLFAAGEWVLPVVASVGVLTALIGASSALVQRDVKRVLAYSTVSQLGYMFLALGTGAFTAAIFHLTTHAFFKALLFLGAGSVIHGMHEEQDAHRMGGLRRHMPVTFATFLCGGAALSGLPLMSGFFSKDEILASAFARGGPYLLLWGLGLVAAAMTAFYTWRLVALVFLGEPRFDPHEVHPHESPRVMTAPLVVLAALSVVGGVLGLPAVLGAGHVLAGWLAPVVAPGTALVAAAHGGHVPHLPHALEWVLLGMGAAVALVFALLGLRAYARGPELDRRLEEKRPAVAGFLAEAWGFDRLYRTLVVRPLRVGAFLIAVFVDQIAIDGLVNGAAAAAVAVGRRTRRAASGSVKDYALWMGAGAALLALLWMWGAR